jgi:hypothetical protein
MVNSQTSAIIGLSIAVAVLGILVIVLSAILWHKRMKEIQNEKANLAATSIADRTEPPL